MDQEADLNDSDVQACLLESAAARARLERALGALKTGFAFDPLDWSRWVRQYPVESVTGSFALGLILSGPARSSSSGERTWMAELSGAGLDAALRFWLRSLL